MELGAGGKVTIINYTVEWGEVGLDKIKIITWRQFGGIKKNDAGDGGVKWIENYEN